MALLPATVLALLAAFATSWLLTRAKNRRTELEERYRTAVDAMRDAQQLAMENSVAEQRQRQRAEAAIGGLDHVRETCRSWAGPDRTLGRAVSAAAARARHEADKWVA